MIISINIAGIIFVLVLAASILVGLILAYHWRRFGRSKLILNPEEKLVLTVRRYWLVFALQNLFLVVFAILPLFFRLLILNVLNGTSYFLLYISWLLILAIIFAVDWTNYYLDAWHLTTERLIDIDQLALFRRHESTTDLGKIQDISISTPGVLATIFRFGTIHVQTAGEKREFAMSYVPDPDQVRARILALSQDLAAKPQKVEIAG